MKKIWTDINKILFKYQSKKLTKPSKFNGRCTCSCDYLTIETSLWPTSNLFHCGTYNIWTNIWTHVYFSRWLNTPSENNRCFIFTSFFPVFIFMGNLTAWREGTAPMQSLSAKMILRLTFEP